MAKVRKAPDGNGYQVCEAIASGWNVYTLPSLDDAYRVAGIEPDFETPVAECENVEGEDDDDISDLWNLVA